MRNCSYRRLMKEMLIILCKEELSTEIKAKEIEQRIERIAKEQVHPSSVSYLADLIIFLVLPNDA